MGIVAGELLFRQPRDIVTLISRLTDILSPVFLNVADLKSVTFSVGTPQEVLVNIVANAAAAALG